MVVVVVVVVVVSLAVVATTAATVRTQAHNTATHVCMPTYMHK